MLKNIITVGVNFSSLYLIVPLHCRKSTGHYSLIQMYCVGYFEIIVSFVFLSTLSIGNYCVGRIRLVTSSSIYQIAIRHPISKSRLLSFCVCLPGCLYVCVSVCVFVCVRVPMDDMHLFERTDDKLVDQGTV